eukprot:14058359-Alexandrium_andersonii.AAC.1
MAATLGAPGWLCGCGHHDQHAGERALAWQPWLLQTRGWPAVPRGHGHETCCPGSGHRELAATRPQW